MTNIMAPYTPPIYRIAVLVLLATFCKGLIPEDDFRIINRRDLLATDCDIFQDNSTESFAQLLFDVARDQVIVGARDTLYRLSLRGLRLLEQASWPASAEKVQLCQDKGQSERACHNYIKTLLAHDERLLACGTGAFSPTCSWREIESVGTVLEWVQGVAKCPHNPRSNVTATFTSSGEYYVGTPTDFAGSDTAIYRNRGGSSAKSATLRTPQYDLNWLNEPQFVGSFEDDSFVYFVFREVAVEFINCGKIIYSRIARVCKNDSGGNVMLKDNWSTFLKARLNCSLPGDYPFYYDEVQSIAYLPHENLLVATFTTPSNSIAGSAVCAYNMSVVRAAFDGAFKLQGAAGGAWEPRAQPPAARRHFRCQANNGAQQFPDYHRYQLMHDSVQPLSGRPLYTSEGQRYTLVTADVTPTTNARSQHVLYVATDRSEVMKLAVLPGHRGACLVELWRLSDDRNKFDIESIQFVKDTTSVYVGGRQGVVRVRAHRCGRFTSRAACAGAADPYCGWEDGRDVCRDTAYGGARLAQSADYCPLLDMPVDGGWSSWSEWEPCVQDNEGSVAGDKPDYCQCRTRRCDNPRPANGGQTCKGAHVAVSRCTVHGGWSAWSAWSQCSASCGIAVKTRRRTCSAPAPRHGGRLCVGQDSQEIYCSSLPPCPKPVLPAVDGGWGAWGAWSACAGGGGACGGGAGWRERRRLCDAPAPQHAGADCEGDALERQVCDLKPCEYKRAAAWTPWMQIAGNSSDGSYTEKRFKFVCKAQSQEQIKISLAKEEDRYCSARGSCGAEPAAGAVEADEEAGGWGAWGAWGACSASCGGGQQLRSRACRRPPCAGAADMLRPCNTHACTGEWSCWSEWSECSGGCGGGGAAPTAGTRQRTRGCLSPEGCADAGAAIERRVCLKDSCGDEGAGWGEWGEWGACSDGERTRRRACERGACAGAVMQVSLCSDDDNTLDNDMNALPAYSHSIEMASFVTLPNSSLGVGSLVGCAVAAFIIGCLTSLAAWVWWWRRGGGGGARLPWRRQTKVPSSPHYITANQNSYVTIPLKDVPRKAKRQPSFTGICSTSSGLVLSKSNNLTSNANNHNNTLTTPKLYPKAIANEYDAVGTLRRQSTNQQHKNNITPDEEKFY